MNKATFIESVRDDATQLAEVLERLRNKRERLLSVGGVKGQGNPNGWLDPAQPVGALEEGITVGDIIAVVATTCEAFEDLLNRGHRANVNKIRR